MANDLLIPPPPAPSPTPPPPNGAGGDVIADLRRQLDAVVSQLATDSQTLAGAQSNVKRLQDQQKTLNDLLAKVTTSTADAATQSAAAKTARDAAQKIHDDKQAQLAAELTDAHRHAIDAAIDAVDGAIATAWQTAHGIATDLAQAEADVSAATASQKQAADASAAAQAMLSSLPREIQTAAAAVTSLASSVTAKYGDGKVSEAYWLVQDLGHRIGELDALLKPDVAPRRAKAAADAYAAARAAAADLATKSAKRDDLKAKQVTADKDLSTKRGSRDADIRAKVLALLQPAPAP